MNSNGNISLSRSDAVVPRPTARARRAAGRAAHTLPPPAAPASRRCANTVRKHCMWTQSPLKARPPQSYNCPEHAKLNIYLKRLLMLLKVLVKSRLGRQVWCTSPHSNNAADKRRERGQQRAKTTMIQLVTSPRTCSRPGRSPNTVKTGRQQNTIYSFRKFGGPARRGGAYRTHISLDLRMRLHCHAAGVRGRAAAAVRRRSRALPTAATVVHHAPPMAHAGSPPNFVKHKGRRCRSDGRKYDPSCIAKESFPVGSGNRILNISHNRMMDGGVTRALSAPPQPLRLRRLCVVHRSVTRRGVSHFRPEQSSPESLSPSVIVFGERLLDPRRST
ncbi:hypothetical protein EVAR_15672_1 [Eumeta japonica]|uniref:Uncharacterized protein n=1 Tax=Eumeta variegata TaxID=151549 RepID=A0A4C1U9L8_EUMVA|nr:hypothetical protein EVAR_15672_1 [Eumeta japonica]